MVARLAASGRAVRKSMATGAFKPVARREKNVIIGRSMARAGVWRAIWK
jgi:pyruvate/2-oxoglutarate dehydrogenase complex dihydrolipoamide dehydrogenase (E3) component